MYLARKRISQKVTIGKIVYLVRDEFTTPQTAPITSPRACVPGPGILTKVDSGNNYSISGGKLVQGGSVGHGDPGIWGAAFARVAGLALMGNWTKPASPSGYFGFDDDQSFLLLAGAINSAEASRWHLYINGVATGRVKDDSVASSTHSMALILRSSGFLPFVKIGSSWCLLYPVKTGTAATVYPAWYGMASGHQMDNFRVARLASPFNTDYGIVTQRIASASVGNTIVHEANGIIEATWTATTSETFELSVRRTDDNNRWVARASQAGSTIKLIEINAGVETERGSAAQTWTNGTNYRVVLSCDGNTIRIFVADSLKIAYGTATFNNNATGAKTSHVVTDLVSWPTVLSGQAAAILNTT